MSSVTGKNLDLLKSFFFVVPPTSSSLEQEKLLQQPAELHVSNKLCVMYAYVCVMGSPQHPIFVMVKMASSLILLAYFHNPPYTFVQLAASPSWGGRKFADVKSVL